MCDKQSREVAKLFDYLTHMYDYLTWNDTHSSRVSVGAILLAGNELHIMLIIAE